MSDSFAERMNRSLGETATPEAPAASPTPLSFAERMNRSLGEAPAASPTPLSFAERMNRSLGEAPTASAAPATADLDYLLKLQRWRYSGGKRFDLPTEQVTGLHPPFRQSLTPFFQGAEKLGYTPQITAGYETGGHSEGSSHYSGKGLDFALLDKSGNEVDPRTTGGAGLSDKLTALAKQHGISFADEYTNPSDAATGPHFHLSHDEAARPQGASAFDPTSGSMAPQGHAPRTLTHLQEIAKDMSVKEGVDPGIFHRLVTAESAWDPVNGHGYNSVGAMGYVQMMPETLKAMTGGKVTNQEFLQNDSLQFRLGARYLRQQLQQFDNNIPRALAAYNAGPGGVAQILKQNSFGHGDWKNQTLPYIAKIMGTDEDTASQLFFSNHNPSHSDVKSWQDTPRGAMTESERLAFEYSQSSHITVGPFGTFDTSISHATINEAHKSFVALFPSIYDDRVKNELFNSPEEFESKRKTALQDTSDYVKRMVSAFTLGFSEYLPALKESGNLSQLSTDKWTSWENLGLRLVPESIGVMSLLGLSGTLGRGAFSAGARGVLGSSEPPVTEFFGRKFVGSLAEAANAGGLKEILAWGGLAGVAGFNHTVAEMQDQGKSWEEITPHAMAALAMNTVIGMGLTKLTHVGLGVARATALGALSAAGSAAAHPIFKPTIGMVKAQYLRLPNELRSVFAASAQAALGPNNPAAKALYKHVQIIEEDAKVMASEQQRVLAIDKDRLRIFDLSRTVEAVATSARAAEETAAKYGGAATDARTAHTAAQTAWHADLQFPVHDAAATSRAPLQARLDHLLATNPAHPDIPTLQAAIRPYDAIINPIELRNPNFQRFKSSGIALQNSVDTYQNFLTSNEYMVYQEEFSILIHGARLPGASLEEAMGNAATPGWNTPPEYDAGGMRVRGFDAYHDDIVLTPPSSIAEGRMTDHQQKHALAFQDVLRRATKERFAANDRNMVLDMTAQASLRELTEGANLPSLESFTDPVGRKFLSAEELRLLRATPAHNALAAKYPGLPATTAAPGEFAVQSSTDETWRYAPEAVARAENASGAAIRILPADELASMRTRGPVSQSQMSGSLAEKRRQGEIFSSMTPEQRQRWDELTLPEGQATPSPPGVPPGRTGKQYRVPAPSGVLGQALSVVSVLSQQDAYLAPGIYTLERVARLSPNIPSPETDAMRAWSKSLDLIPKLSQTHKADLMGRAQALLMNANPLRTVQDISGIVKHLATQRINLSYVQHMGFRVVEEAMTALEAGIKAGEFTATSTATTPGRVFQDVRRQLMERVAMALEEPLHQRALGRDPFDPTVMKNSLTAELLKDHPNLAAGMQQLATFGYAMEKFQLAAPEMAGFHIMDHVLHIYPLMAKFTQQQNGIDNLESAFTNWRSEHKREVPFLFPITGDTLRRAGRTPAEIASFNTLSTAQRRAAGFPISAQELTKEALDKLRGLGVSERKFMEETPWRQAQLLGHGHIRNGELGNAELRDPANAAIKNEITNTLIGVLMQNPETDMRIILKSQMEGSFKANAARQFLRYLQMVENPWTGTPLLTLGKSGDLNPAGLQGHVQEGVGRWARAVQTGYVSLAELPGMANARLKNQDGGWTKASDMYIDPEAARTFKSIYGKGKGTDDPLGWFDKVSRFTRMSMLAVGSPIVHLTKLWSHTMEANMVSAGKAAGIWNGAAHVEEGATDALARLAMTGEWNPKAQRLFHQAIVADFRRADSGLYEFLRKGEDSLSPFSRTMKRLADTAAAHPAVPGAAKTADFLDHLVEAEGIQKNGLLAYNAWLDEHMLFRPAEYASATASLLKASEYIQGPIAAAARARGVAEDVIHQRALQSGARYVNMVMGTVPMAMFSDSLKNVFYKTFLVPHMMMSRVDNMLGALEGPIFTRLGYRSRFDSLPAEYREQMRGEYRRLFAASIVGGFVFLQSLSYLLNNHSTLQNPPGKEFAVRIGTDSDGKTGVYMANPLFGWFSSFTRAVGGVAADNDLKPVWKYLVDQSMPLEKAIDDLMQNRDNSGKPIIPPTGLLGQVTASAQYAAKNVTNLSDIFALPNINAMDDGRHAHSLKTDPIGWMVDRMSFAIGPVISRDGPTNEIAQMKDALGYYKKKQTENFINKFKIFLLNPKSPEGQQARKDAMVEALVTGIPLPQPFAKAAKDGKLRMTRAEIEGLTKALMAPSALMALKRGDPRFRRIFVDEWASHHLPGRQQEEDSFGHYLK